MKRCLANVKIWIIKIVLLLLAVVQCTSAAGTLCQAPRNPRHHRLQNVEYDLLLEMASHLYRSLPPEEIKMFRPRPTWALRKWRRENFQHGHFTWREELSLLEVMRGNDYQGEYIDSEVTAPDSEDDEPIANVCRERPAGDGRQSKDSDEEPIASLLQGGPRPPPPPPPHDSDAEIDSDEEMKRKFRLFDGLSIQDSTILAARREAEVKPLSSENIMIWKKALPDNILIRFRDEEDYQPLRFPKDRQKAKPNQQSQPTPR